MGDVEDSFECVRDLLFDRARGLLARGLLFERSRGLPFGRTLRRVVAIVST